MTFVRTTLAAAVLALTGFAGAQALASQSPPLVSNCTNVSGWDVEVLYVDCISAGKIVRRLTVLAPNAPLRLSGMTCSVGYARKIATAIRCAGGNGRFLRGNLRLQGAKATPLPAVSRCSDYVDKLKRRWAIRSERFGCLDATDIVAELALTRPTSDDVDFVERRHNVSCRLFANGGFPRELSCGGWRNFGSKSAFYGWFFAHVKLAPTPTTTTATTTIRRP